VFNITYLTCSLETTHYCHENHDRVISFHSLRVANLTNYSTLGLGSIKPIEEECLRSYSKLEQLPRSPFSSQGYTPQKVSL